MEKGCTFASLFRGTPLVKRENIERIATIEVVQETVAADRRRYDSPVNFHPIQEETK